MSVSWCDYDNDGFQDLYVGDMWSAAGERISHEDVFKKTSPADVHQLYRKHAMGNSLLRKPWLERQPCKFSRCDQFRRSWHGPLGVGRAMRLIFDHDGFLDLYIANGMITGPSPGDLNSFFWRQVVANSPDEQKSSPEYEQGWNAVNELIRSDRTWSGFERNVFLRQQS